MGAGTGAPDPGVWQLAHRGAESLPRKKRSRFDAHALDLTWSRSLNRKIKGPRTPSPKENRLAEAEVRNCRGARNPFRVVGSSVSQLGKTTVFVLTERRHRNMLSHTHIHTNIDAVGSCGGSLHCTRRGSKKKE